MAPESSRPLILFFSTNKSYKSKISIQLLTFTAVLMANQYFICSEGFTEKCVMNNYFGIGLDAKIALDFHTRREEHPEKFRYDIEKVF